MSVAKALFSELSQIEAAVGRSDQVLVVLDYDGTLAPIVEDPKDAAVPPETCTLLARVATVHGWTLAIVSGRSLSDLKSRMGAGAVLAGNHGLEIEGPGISFVHECAQRAIPVLAGLCWELEARFKCIPGVIVECKDLTATVHFRRAPRELGAWIRATVETVVGPARSLLYLAPALQAVELRPRIDWNKGSAVRFLLGRMRAANPLLICAGDDRTDEDMFRIVPDEISIKVGSHLRTKAHYYVRSPQELRRFLQWLSGEDFQTLPADRTVLHASDRLAAFSRVTPEDGFRINRKHESALRSESSLEAAGDQKMETAG